MHALYNEIHYTKKIMVLHMVSGNFIYLKLKCTGMGTWIMNAKSKILCEKIIIIITI